MYETQDRLGKRVRLELGYRTNTWVLQEEEGQGIDTSSVTFRAAREVTHMAVASDRPGFNFR